MDLGKRPHSVTVVAGIATVLMLCGVAYVQQKRSIDLCKSEGCWPSVVGTAESANPPGGRRGMVPPPQQRAGPAPDGGGHKNGQHGLQKQEQQQLPGAAVAPPVVLLGGVHGVTWVAQAQLGDDAGASGSDAAADSDSFAALPFRMLDPERVKALPRIEECRVCKACVPAEEEARLLRRAKGAGVGGGVGSRSDAEDRLQQQRRRQRRLARLQHAAGAAHDLPEVLSRGTEELGPARRFFAVPPSGNRVEESGGGADDGGSEARGGPVTATAAAGRPPIDGVRTHAAWVATHGAHVAAEVAPGVEVVTGYTNTTFEWHGATYRIAPESIVHAAGLIRTCQVCRGCEHQLRWMPKGTSMLGSKFTHETGASPGWLLRVKSNRSRTGEAAVKVWCVPVRKPGAPHPPNCNPDRIRKQLQIVLAQQRVAQECGLTDVLPAAWVGPVRGVLPHGGYRIDWDGLWSELSPGASLENVVARGSPPPVPAAVLDLLQRRISRTDAVAAAMFDLLTSQCDRHGQNVYVSRKGRISLIDNDQAYGSSWRPCGVDSVFLPGTQKHEVARLGFKYVTKSPRAAPERQPLPTASPLQLLDYRCHAPGGAIGTAYPPRVAECLAAISGMTKQQVQVHYGFPHIAAAAALRRRASDMLSRGFEWALRHGWPRNPAPMRYKWAPPCCRMHGEQLKPGERPVYECVDASGRGPSALPLGDPYFGGPWAERANDTGSYELLEPGALPPHANRTWPADWVPGAWLGDDDGAPDHGYAPQQQPSMYNR